MRKLKAFANFDIEKLFNDFEKEYLSCCHGQRNTEYKEQQHSTNNACRYFVKDKAEEEKIIKNFLRTPCKCGNSCQKKLDLEEVLNVRNDFQQLSWREKGCFILPLLNSFRTQANTAKSARTVLSRSRQKYTYRINYDREVCRDTFLFYYDLSIAKLRYFQNHLVDIGMTPPEHGNIGRKPANSYSENDKNHIKKFMINFATAHGMPDPGRDLRSGIEKFKIFLPSVMSYKHVHTVYLKSLSKRNRAVEYQSFIRIWQEATPNIEFQKPKTDMCGTCEDHIKKHTNGDRKEKGR